MKIFLIGFMGAGKTTLGKYAAKHNNLQFIDLDEYLEQKLGLEIREVFQNRGEAYFRDEERIALLEVATMAGDHIISCGGGTPCFFENIAFMNRAGTTIYLDLSAARLTERLRNSPEKRPLINSITTDLQVFVHQKLMERAAFYAQAQVILSEEESTKPGLRRAVFDILAGNRRRNSGQEGANSMFPPLG
jgi:shikimate kinase